MTTVSWAITGILLLLLVQMIRAYHRRRLRLVCYVVYLLLSDDTRSSHKEKFEQYLSNLATDDPIRVGVAAHMRIDRMADDLACPDPRSGAISSVLGSHAMIHAARNRGRLPLSG